MQHPIVRPLCLFLTVASCPVALLGCDNTQAPQAGNAAATLGAAITRAAAAQPGERIDLAKLSDFDWQRLYIFGPHARESEIESALGFDWLGVSKTKIAKSDEVSLL